MLCFDLLGLRALQFGPRIAYLLPVPLLSIYLLNVLRIVEEAAGGLRLSQHGPPRERAVDLSQPAVQLLDGLVNDLLERVNVALLREEQGRFVGLQCVVKLIKVFEFGAQVELCDRNCVV